MSDPKDTPPRPPDAATDDPELDSTVEDAAEEVEASDPDAKVYRCVAKGCGYLATYRWIGPCPSCMCYETPTTKPKPKPSETSLATAKPKPYVYVPTGILGFDQVLNRGEDTETRELLAGGVVKGQVYLISGRGGAGKTTCLLKALDGLARLGKRVVYVSAEESSEDIAATAHRLGCTADIEFRGNMTDLEKIQELLEEGAPPKPGKERTGKIPWFCMVVDSVNTVTRGDVGGGEGSNEQLNAITNYFAWYTKEKKSTAFFLVAHVNAKGEAAGPKSMMHNVDVLLEFDYMFPGSAGPRDPEARRVLTTVGKYRRGKANVVRYFRMTQTGLEEIDPPESFLMAPDDGDDEPPSPKNDKPWLKVVKD